LPFLNRSFPPSFWFALRPIRRLIFSVLWELPILASLLQPNPKEFLSKRLYLSLPCGRTPSRTGLCPQLQAREAGTKGCLQIIVSRPKLGTASVLLNAWNFLWPRPRRTKTFW
jgi:hypothetical protein